MPIFPPSITCEGKSRKFWGKTNYLWKPEESYESWVDDACFSDGCHGAVADGEDTNWTKLSQYAIKSSFFVWEVILGRTTIPKPRWTCQTGITAGTLPRSGQ